MRASFAPALQTRAPLVPACGDNPAGSKAHSLGLTALAGGCCVVCSAAPNWTCLPPLLSKATPHLGFRVRAPRAGSYPALCLRLLPPQAPTQELPSRSPLVSPQHHLELWLLCRPARYLWSTTAPCIVMMPQALAVERTLSLRSRTWLTELRDQRYNACPSVAPLACRRPTWGLPGSICARDSGLVTLAPRTAHILGGGGS